MFSFGHGQAPSEGRATGQDKSRSAPRGNAFSLLTMVLVQLLVLAPEHRQEVVQRILHLCNGLVRPWPCEALFGRGIPTKSSRQWPNGYGIWRLPLLLGDIAVSVVVVAVVAGGGAVVVINR